MNTDLITLRKSQLYLKEINNILGGFPALDSEWNNQTFDWLYSNGLLINYGVYGFFNEEFILDDKITLTMSDLRVEHKLDNESISDKSSLFHIKNKNIMKSYLMSYGVSARKLDQVIVDIFVLWVELLYLSNEIFLTKHYDFMKLDEMDRSRGFIMLIGIKVTFIARLPRWNLLKICLK